MQCQKNTLLSPSVCVYLFLAAIWQQVVEGDVVVEGRLTSSDLGANSLKWLSRFVILARLSRSHT